MSPRAANGGITDMMTYARPLMATLLALVLLLGTAPRARAATSPSEGEAQATGRTGLVTRPSQHPPGARRRALHEHPGRPRDAGGHAGLRAGLGRHAAWAREPGARFPAIQGHE